jgi:hypothetical protein
LSPIAAILNTMHLLWAINRCFCNRLYQSCTGLSSLTQSACRWIVHFYYEFTDTEDTVYYHLDKGRVNFQHHFGVSGMYVVCWLHCHVSIVPLETTTNIRTEAMRAAVHFFKFKCVRFYKIYFEDQRKNIKFSRSVR